MATTKEIVPATEKEVATVKQTASRMIGSAQLLEIKTPEQRKEASDILSEIKTNAKNVKALKETITKPMMTALDNARGLFKPIEANLASAEAIIKEKMLGYDAEQERIAEAARAKLAARVEKGTMKPETAVAKMSEIEAPQNTVVGDRGGMTQTRTIKKYRVVDASLLPREYLIPNMPAITEALKAGKTVPGAEAYEEKVISAR